MYESDVRNPIYKTFVAAQMSPRRGRKFTRLGVSYLGTGLACNLQRYLIIQNPRSDDLRNSRNLSQNGRTNQGE